MPEPWERPVDPATKILIVCAIGVGVGFGTCGLALLVAAGNDGILQYAPMLGASIFFLSLAGLVVTGAFMIVRAVMRSFKK